MKENDENRKKLLQECLDKNMTRKEIAGILNISKNSVNGLCTRYGIPFDFKKINLERKRKHIEENYNPDKTLSANLKTMRHAYKFAKKILEEKGIEIKSNLSPEKRDELIKEIKEGNIKMVRLAEKYGLSRQRIYQIKKQLISQEECQLPQKQD